MVSFFVYNPSSNKFLANDDKIDDVVTYMLNFARVAVELVRIPSAIVLKVNAHA